MKSLSSLFLMMWLLAACSIPSPEKRTDGDSQYASFFVADVKPSFSAATAEKNFGIVKSLTLNVTACLKKNQKSQALVQHDFEISGGEKSLRQTTDPQGCLTWNEEISFNPTANSSWILIERKVEAIGVEKGSRQVKVFINPWSEKAMSEKESSLPEGSYLKGEEALKALKGTDAKPAALRIENVIARIDETASTAKGANLLIQIETAVKISRLDHKGTPVLEELSKGTFLAQVELLHIYSADGKEQRAFLKKDLPVIKQSLVDRTLRLQVPVNLEKICTRGYVALALSIEAVDAPVPMSKFTGVFNLGECDQLKGQFFGRANTTFSQHSAANPSFSTTDYVAETSPEAAKPATANPPAVGATPVKETSESVTNDKDFYQTARPEIRQLRFTAVGFKGAEPVQRTRKFDAQAMLVMGLDRRPLRGQTFQITKINGQTENVRSKDEGAIGWEDSLDYSAFSNECWAKKTVRIQNKDLGLDQTIELLVNPFAESADPVRDLRYTSKDKAVEECAKGPQEIVTTGYDFQKAKFDYSLDEFMNLEVQKHGLLRIAARLKRPSLSNANGFAEDALPVGDYVVRLAVVDISVQDFTSAEKAANKVFMSEEFTFKMNGNSTLVGDVSLSSRNIKAIGNTNQLLVQIQPVNGGTFTPKVYRGLLTMANNVESSALTLIENADPMIIQNLAAQMKQDHSEAVARWKLLADKSKYAARNKLRLVNLNEEKSSEALRFALANPYKLMDRHAWTRGSDQPAWKVENLKAMLEKDPDSFGEDFRSSLCAYWFYDYWQRQVPSKNAMLNKHGLANELMADVYATADCMKATKKTLRGFFDVETKYFVQKVSKESVQESGVRDFMVSHAFSMNRSYSDTSTFSYGFGVEAGLSLPALKMIGIEAGGQVGYSRSFSESETLGAGTSYSAGISLKIETLKLRVKAEDYEKCLVIKMDPNQMRAGQMAAKNLNPKMTEQEKAHYPLTGFMFCDGDTRKKPIVLDETFYVVNQDLGTTQMLDPTSDANRPLFATMRGEGDLAAFLSYMKKDHGVPTSYESDFLVTKMKTSGETQMFLRGTRNVPGVVTKY